MPATAYAITPSDIVIPLSSQTVTVKLLEAFPRFAGPGQIFYTPAPGATAGDVLAAPGLVFLIEHDETGRRVMFDIGLRKDYDQLAPVIAQSGFGFGKGKLDAVIDKDVPTQLQEGGVDLGSIEAVIWRCAVGFFCP
jgi:hypothetical protein